MQTSERSSPRSWGASASRPASASWSHRLRTKGWVDIRSASDATGGDRPLLRGDALDQVGRANRSPRGLEPDGHGPEASAEVRIREQAIDRIGQVGSLEVVRGESNAQAQLVDALGVVVLVPEQRQDHHRLAEV